MTSREQIKAAFVSELTNTPQYQIVLAIKQAIMNEIAVPNIQQHVKYTFPTKLTEADISVLKLCMQVEFGFIEHNISETCIVVDMQKFLN